MHNQFSDRCNHLLNAVDVVLTWDLSDEAFPEAFLAQANLMAGSTND